MSYSAERVNKLNYILRWAFLVLWVSRISNDKHETRECETVLYLLQNYPITRAELLSELCYVFKKRSCQLSMKVS